MADAETNVPRARRFAHLSAIHPDWEQVAEGHKAIEQASLALYNLPIEEFRKVPYRAPPLPADAPVIGQDLTVKECKVPVRDGTFIRVRIYLPLTSNKHHLIFYNVHGGGKAMI